MKKLFGTLIQFVVLMLVFVEAFAQYPGAKLLFIGSSTIAYWKGRIANDFPHYTIYNEGVPGTTFPYLTAHIKDYAKKYPEVKTIVVYSGDNDIALPFNTPHTVANDMRVTLNEIHNYFPGAHVFVFSIKPCPVVLIRARLQTVKETNALMLDRVNELNKWATAKEGQPFVTFLDIFPKMLTDNGHPNAQLFSMPLGIHLNNNGYKIWRDSLTPYLYADI